MMRLFKRPVIALWLAGIAILAVPLSAPAQMVNHLSVEITTKNVIFAGTDDSVYLNFAGIEHKLDTPNHDDFERGHTDTYEIDLSATPLDFALVRQIREFTIRKPSDSFFGGNWDFQAITLRVQFADPHPDPVEPLYINPNVGVELNAENRSWTARTTDTGWNFPPEPPSWPPCTVIDVEPGGGTFIDSDCDNIPDESDGTFDTPPDSDGDGLPDPYETQTGTSPTDPDADDDGWRDGGNIRHALVLRSVENVSGFADFFNVVVEDIRYPSIEGLQESWSAAPGKQIPVNFIVDQRAAGGGTVAPEPTFLSRVHLRGRTISRFGPFSIDGSLNVRWPTPSPIIVAVDKPFGSVQLTFQSIVLTPFLDPNPLDPTADTDGDGLSDEMEFAIASLSPSTRPEEVPPPDGYAGLADPGQQDLFLEIDWSGEDYKVQDEAKIRVATRYHINYIAPRFDDGYLGGGNELPYEAPISLEDLEQSYKCNPKFFWRERLDHFHYMLSVDRMTDILSDIFFQANGKARRPGTNLIISRQTMLGEFSAIVFIHELGHNLSLCHPVGTNEPPSPSPICDANGDPPAGWSGCRNYCGVGDNDVTAMGDDVGFDSIIGGAAGGAVIGAGIGFGVGGPVGAAVGAGVGAVIGGLLGFFNSDAWLRVVDYHPNEWVAVRKERVVRGLILRPGLDVNFPAPPQPSCVP